MQTGLFTPSMSPAAQVANTTDILELILAHPFTNKDLTAFLCVSPVFFHIAGRRLYHTLPISNALNLVSSSGLGREGASGGSTYSREQLLPHVRTVVVERAAIPQRPIWAGWEELSPLPYVETIIIQPAGRSLRQKGGQDTSLPSNALIERLCPTATRLHLSTRCYTRGVKSAPHIPSLPNVHTLVLKGRVSEIKGLGAVLRKDNETSPCPNVREVHLLFWGDVVYPAEAFKHIAWPGEKGISRRRVAELVDASYVHLRHNIYLHLCDLVEVVGTMEQVKVLHLYNVGPVLKRMFDWGVNGETAEDMMNAVEKSFVREEERASEGEALPVVSSHPATAFYKTFGFYGRDKEEAWYKSTVIKPSAKLVDLRAQLADRTKKPAYYYLGLKVYEAETVLDHYKG